MGASKSHRRKQMDFKLSNVVLTENPISATLEFKRQVQVLETNSEVLFSKVRRIPIFRNYALLHK